MCLWGRGIRLLTIGLKPASLQRAFHISFFYPPDMSEMVLKKEKKNPQKSSVNPCKLSVIHYGYLHFP